MSKVVLLYCPCSNEDEAKKIADALLLKKLVACVNFLPMRSSFWWKGKIENANEVLLLAKTLKKKILDVEKEVKLMHSYGVPCISFYEALNVGREYEEYVVDSIS